LQLKFFLSFVCFFIAGLGVNVFSQTLIINELSNGPSGNKEYVELLVASDTVTYVCSSATPPCLDIRGWIFDDNSGYHGGPTGTGVAPGAVRFSNNTLWSCVPVGTIIVLYNDQDVNAAIPAPDLSLNDGNCRLIVPINNAQLLESNTTTPGAIACSYPAANWTPGGNWNNTVLANSGDCARIVDLGGCEVFSVCYGTANTNNQIYFAGSGATTVYFFNGTNPTQQSNWSAGCTNAASCGTNAQTPGLPNNVANAGYIAQFNNACLPITPLQLTVQTTQPLSCNCTGAAVASATGSIPGYTYQWLNAAGQSIGTAATISNLCPGVYSCIATSNIGCTDTVSVTIASGGSALIEPQFVGVGPLCQGTTFSLPISSLNAISGTWAPAISSTQTQTYVFTPSAGQCADTTSLTVVINTQINPVFPASDTICLGESYTLSNTSLNAIVGTWAPALSLVQSQTYTFTPAVASSCMTQAFFNLVVQTPVQPQFTAVGPYCQGMNFSLPSSSTNGILGTWSPAISTNQTQNYQFTPYIDQCADSAFMTVVINPTIVPLFETTDTICLGEPYTLSNTSQNAISGSWSPALNLNQTLAYTFTASNTSACYAQANFNLVVNMPPNAQIAPSAVSTGLVPLSLTISAQNPTPGASYFWQTSNGLQANGTSVNTILTEPGCLAVSLMASLNGCTAFDTIAIYSCAELQDTTTDTVSISPDVFVFYIPNAFTPDADQYNPYFKVCWSGSLPKFFEFEVFNRWGELVFKTSDPNFGWDGTSALNGQFAPDGLYTWKLTIGLSSVKEHRVYSGHVSLLR
jgi:gliding motility-associated-like protein